MLGVVGVASRSPWSPSLPVLLLAWCLAQMCFNATLAALYGILADIVPEHDRARVSGWFGAAVAGAVIVSMVVVAAFPTSRIRIFLPMPLRAVVCGLVARRHFESMGEVDRAARWVAIVTILSSALSMVTEVVVGRDASRTGSYGPIVGCAMALIAAVLVLKACAPSLLLYAVATALIGLGIGCYFAIDRALVVRTVPAQAAGRFLGAFNIARTLPQSLAPAIAPLLLGLGDGDVSGSGAENYSRSIVSRRCYASSR